MRRSVVRIVSPTGYGGGHVVGGWCILFFFCPATTEFYTLSLHDALPIYFGRVSLASLPANLLAAPAVAPIMWLGMVAAATIDRKSTRLNSSHVSISYAVFCTKKKNLPSDDRFLFYRFHKDSHSQAPDKQT